MNPAHSEPRSSPRSALRLPAVSEESQPGGRLVGRSVGIALWSAATLAIIGLLVAATVRVPLTIRAMGDLEPAHIWPVRSLETGIVLDVAIEAGDSVEVGQTMFRLDPLELAGALAGLEAELDATDADALRAEHALPLDRREREERIALADARLVTVRAGLLQRMVEYGLGTDVDSLAAALLAGRHVGVELALAEVRAAEAEKRLAAVQADAVGLGSFDRTRRSAERRELAARVEVMRERFRRLSIVAPTRGVVLTEGLERLVGGRVQAGDLLAEVADITEWRAKLAVTEHDAHRVQPGDPVRFRLGALGAGSAKILDGMVEHVAAEVSPESSTYRVLARIGDASQQAIVEERVRRGYSVEGQIVTRRVRLLRLLWEKLVE